MLLINKVLGEPNSTFLANRVQVTTAPPGVNSSSHKTFSVEDAIVSLVVLRSDRYGVSVFKTVSRIRLKNTATEREVYVH